MTEAGRFLPPDPKGEFPYEVSIYLLNLLVAVNSARDRMLEDALRPLELSVARYRTMAVIWRMSPCTMGALAALMVSDRTTLTRTVDKLVASGMVDRRADDEDRRKVLLTITDPGRAKLRAAEIVVRQMNAEALSRVPESTRRVMVDGLQTILGGLGTTADSMSKVLAPRQLDEYARGDSGGAGARP